MGNRKLSILACGSEHYCVSMITQFSRFCNAVSVHKKMHAHTQINILHKTDLKMCICGRMHREMCILCKKCIEIL